MGNHPIMIRLLFLSYFVGFGMSTLDREKLEAIQLNSHLQLHQQVSSGTKTSQLQKLRFKSTSSSSIINS